MPHTGVIFSQIRRCGVFVTTLRCLKCEDALFILIHRSVVMESAEWGNRISAEPLPGGRFYKCRSHFRLGQEYPSRKHLPWVAIAHALWQRLQPPFALFQRNLHAAGYFHIALHIVHSVCGVRWRQLRFCYFPHLALRCLLVELVEKCHGSLLFVGLQAQNYAFLFIRTNKVAFFE